MGVAGLFGAGLAWQHHHLRGLALHEFVEAEVDLVERLEVEDALAATAQLAGPNWKALTNTPESETIVNRGWPGCRS